MKKKTLLSLSLLSVAALVACGPKTSEASGSSNPPFDSTDVTPSSQPGTSVLPDTPWYENRPGQNLAIEATDGLINATTALPSITASTQANLTKAIEVDGRDLTAEETKSITDVIAESDANINRLTIVEDLIGWSEGDTATEGDPNYVTKSTTNYTRFDNNIVQSSTAVTGTYDWKDEAGNAVEKPATANHEEVIVTRSENGVNSIHQLQKNSIGTDDYAELRFDTQYSDDEFLGALNLGAGAMFSNYYDSYLANVNAITEGNFNYATNGEPTLISKFVDFQGKRIGYIDASLMAITDENYTIPGTTYIINFYFDYQIATTIVDGNISNVFFKINRYIQFLNVEGRDPESLYYNEKTEIDYRTSVSQGLGNFDVTLFGEGKTWAFDNFLYF